MVITLVGPSEGSPPVMLSSIPTTFEDVLGSGALTTRGWPGRERFSHWQSTRRRRLRWWRPSKMATTSEAESDQPWSSSVFSVAE